MTNSSVTAPPRARGPACDGRNWRRYSRFQSTLRLMVWMVVVAAIVQSLRTIEVIPEFLYDAPQQMADLLRRMWPVDWAYYPVSVHTALLETIHIASVGTLLSTFVGIPLGFLVAHNLARNRAINFFVRVLLVGSRSVNSLVWALLFVAIFGPGPLAGTFAIAFRSIGFIGKLIGEAVEETPPGPIEALAATGASQFSCIWYGYWTHIKPAFCSIVLLRWDINVRESAVLGLVGAGGIGMVFDTALNLFQWQRVALILVAIFAVVIVAEIFVTQIRKRILIG